MKLDTQLYSKIKRNFKFYIFKITIVKVNNNNIYYYFIAIILAIKHGLHEWF